eukprot:gnl/TRDRNA2_/TRDRNA2_90971_c0_seq1.p1 gnl/TRDRNA2_/TRDRNA2_90971_c0~~gnl/TRDRNA2_/TRDRNA2_90971_c0_seq1.p1  ORF type:complete len:446 (+),score=111.30 gnl/TRDRNA2_/TRDRNA2_90971_c0_seq1:81-1340(+)
MAAEAATGGRRAQEEAERRAAADAEARERRARSDSRRRHHSRPAEPPAEPPAEQRAAVEQVAAAAPAEQIARRSAGGARDRSMEKRQASGYAGGSIAEKDAIGSPLHKQPSSAVSRPSPPRPPQAPAKPTNGSKGYVDQSSARAQPTANVSSVSAGSVPSPCRGQAPDAAPVRAPASPPIRPMPAPGARPASPPIRPMPAPGARPASPPIRPMAAPAAPASAMASNFHNEFGNSGGIGTGGQGDEEASNVVLVPCSHCGRTFRQEALVRHEALCVKVFQKKRKEFNALAHAVPEEALQVKKEEMRAHGGKEAAPQKLNAKWKKQSESFRQAIKASRMVAQFQKEGRPMSELPPPPATDPELDDRIQCQYCGRRFGQQQHERHVQHCKNAKARPNNLKAGAAAARTGAAGKAPARPPKGR